MGLYIIIIVAFKLKTIYIGVAPKSVFAKMYFRTTGHYGRPYHMGEEAWLSEPEQRTPK